MATLGEPCEVETEKYLRYRTGKTAWERLTHSAALLGYGQLASFVAVVFLGWLSGLEWTKTDGATSVPRLDNWTVLSGIILPISASYAIGTFFNIYQASDEAFAGPRLAKIPLILGVILVPIFYGIHAAALSAGTDSKYFGLDLGLLFLYVAVFIALDVGVRNNMVKEVSQVSVLPQIDFVASESGGKPAASQSTQEPETRGTTIYAHILDRIHLLVYVCIIFAYPFGVIPLFFSSSTSTRIFICLVLHPVLLEAAEALGRGYNAAPTARSLRQGEITLRVAEGRIMQRSVMSFFLKQIMAFYRRFMLLNMGSADATLVALVVTAIEEAAARGFLVQIDTTIRSLRGLPELTGDELRLQRLTWMCDTNQSCIAEFNAILTSSFAYVLLQRHAVIFAIGYEANQELNTATVFVQLLVELALEMLVDNTTMWAESEHGIPVVRYFALANGVSVFGFHAAVSMTALCLSLYAFIRHPHFSSCNSCDVCGCLDEPMFREWVGEPCASSNGSAWHNFTDDQADPTRDLLDDVDFFAVLIALFAGIASFALIVLAVLFARYRKRTNAVNQLRTCVSNAEIDASDAKSMNYQLKKKLGQAQRAIDEAINEKAATLKHFCIKFAELTFIDEIGQGSYGVVWKGEFQHNVVAIKTVRVTKVTEDVVKDFMKEIELMAPLRHDSLVSLIGGCWKDGPDNLCLVLEYCARGTLKHLLEGDHSGYNWRTPYFAITLGVASCFRYLHHELPSGEPILHRDLKSDNVMICDDLSPRVGDFGGSTRFDQEEALRRIADNGNLILFIFALVTGTPLYTAPEILSGRPYNIAVDVYSFAIMLLEIGCLSHLFIAKQFHSAQRLAAVHGWRPSPSPELVKDHPGLWELVQRCWHPDPRSRPTFVEITQRARTFQIGDLLTSRWGDCKLVYIGNTEAGKSTLVKLLLGQQTEGDTPFDTTLGVARLRYSPFDFGCGNRKKRSDAGLSDEIKTAIFDVVRTHCPVSPAKKDVLKRTVSPHVTEQRSIRWRYLTWNVIWANFKRKYPALALRIQLHSDPTRCPARFKDAALDEFWNLVMGCSVSCLCRSCSNAEKHAKAGRAVARMLQDWLDSYDELRAEDPGLPEPPAAFPNLIRILSLQRKYALCLAVTCGGESDTDKLCDRAVGCIEKNCVQCPTIAKLWGTVRMWLRLNGEYQHQTFSELVAYESYAYRIKGGVQPAAGADADYAAKESKEIYVKSNSGTIDVFLNAFHKVMQEHVEHRSILDCHNRSVDEQDKNSRPWMLEDDIDFGENMSIEDAELLQSEHWNTKGMTIFMQNVSWLIVSVWNKTTGTLEVGDEVTARGEMSGEAIARDSFFATVCGVPNDENLYNGVYTVRNDNGDEFQLPRAELRHRVRRHEANVGITGDKKHDSAAAMHFCSAAMRKLKARDVWTLQEFRAQCRRSDNAAQHFRSTRTLHAFGKDYAELLREVEALDADDDTHITVIWEFGAPGHGKGIWDGLMGMLKQWLRTRILESREGAHLKLATSSGRCDCAHDCFELLEGFFASDDWTKKKGAKIDQWHFEWAGLNDIRRDDMSTFQTLDKIKYWYQFLSVGPQQYAARRFGCWCLECLELLRKGPSKFNDESFLADLVVPDCTRGSAGPYSSYYEFHNKSCFKVNAGVVAERGRRLKEQGASLAQHVVPGWDLVFEAPDQDEQELWVGRAVKWDEWGGGPAVLKVTEEGWDRFYDDAKQTYFDVGDYKMAVEWRAIKVDGGPDEYVYEDGRIDLVNSVNLRLAHENIMKLVGDSPRERSRAPRGAAAIAQERSDLLKRVWKLPSQYKALALKHCNPPAAS